MIADTAKLGPDNRTVIVVGPDRSMFAAKVAELVLASQADYRNSAVTIVGSGEFRDAIMEAGVAAPAFHFLDAKEIDAVQGGLKHLLLTDLLVVEECVSVAGRNLVLQVAAKREMDVIGCVAVQDTRSAGFLTGAKMRDLAVGGRPYTVVSCFPPEETEAWIASYRPPFVIY